MRFTGVTRKEVAPGAERYIGQARTLLGMVQARIDASGGLLTQYMMRQRLPDGRIIFAESINGQRKITITEIIRKEGEVIPGGLIARYYDDADFSSGYDELVNGEWVEMDTVWPCNKKKWPGKTEALREYGGVDWVSAGGATILTFGDKGESRHTMHAYHDYVGGTIYSEGEVFAESPLRDVYGVAINEGLLIVIGRLSQFDYNFYVYSIALTEDLLNSSSDDWEEEHKEPHDQQDFWSYFNFNRAGTQAVAVLKPFQENNIAAQALLVSVSVHSSFVEVSFGTTKNTAGFTERSTHIPGTFTNSPWAISETTNDVINNAYFVHPLDAIDPSDCISGSTPHCDESFDSMANCFKAKLATRYSQPVRRTDTPSSYDEVVEYASIGPCGSASGVQPVSFEHSSTSAAFERQDPTFGWVSLGSTVSAHEHYMAELKSSGEMTDDEIKTEYKGEVLFAADYANEELVYAVETHNMTYSNLHTFTRNHTNKKVVGTLTLAGCVEDAYTTTGTDVGSESFSCTVGSDHGIKIDTINDILPCKLEEKGSLLYNRINISYPASQTTTAQGSVSYTNMFDLLALDIRYGVAAYQRYRDKVTWTGHTNISDYVNTRWDRYFETVVYNNGVKQVEYEDNVFSYNGTFKMEWCPRSTPSDDDSSYITIDDFSEGNIACCASETKLLSFRWYNKNYDYQRYNKIFDRDGFSHNPIEISDLGLGRDGSGEDPLIDVENLNGYFEELSII